MKNPPRINRREFLRTGSFGALGLLAGNVTRLSAQTAGQSAGQAASDGPQVNVAIIGAGPWGRELIAAVSTIAGAKLHTVCESYPPFLRRATRAAPEAKAVEDFRTVLDDPEVDAVIVSTATHQHREIAIAALEAGKHVYCEAPMASTVEDARAIAQAAKAASSQIFQVGQQLRADPQHHHVLQFVRTGALGDLVMTRGQWHKKESWRRVSPDRDRERETNWRLSRDISTGLIGEIGIHQIDVASWFLNERPVAVHGFGGIKHWNDGRNVPDTVQVVIEYPNGTNFLYSCSLANSYDGYYDVFQGSDGAILLRDNQAWMFREPDAPLLGWEVYARKDEFFQQTGISLVADATQLLAQGLDPASNAKDGNAPVYSALEEFVSCIQESRQPNAGYQEGFEAAVVAIKANEAVLRKEKIVYQDDWFQL